MEFFDGPAALLARIASIDNAPGREELPALIILDLNMGEIDGHDVLRMLKDPGGRFSNKWNEVPVIINSGDHADSAADKSIELGAMAYLRKSADLADLHRLTDFLGSHLQKYGSD